MTLPNRSPIRPGEARQTLLAWDTARRTQNVPVACLFVRADSVYKTWPSTDCYDAERDALTFPGGMPVVAHPPCRLWGPMRHCSTAPEAEKALALWAIEQVRLYGGVLEHPAASALWNVAGVPLGESRDSFGGYSVSVDQWHWGHLSRKPTRLYIVGCPVEELPPIPFRPGGGEAVICRRWDDKEDTRPILTKKERESTPLSLSAWLVTVARRCFEYRQLPRPVQLETEKVCPVCGGLFQPRTRGRPSLVCSATCRLIRFRQGAR